MRRLQDPSFATTYLNSYVQPDETVFLDVLVHLNMYCDVPFFVFGSAAAQNCGYTGK